MSYFLAAIDVDIDIDFNRSRYCQLKPMRTTKRSCGLSGIKANAFQMDNRDIKLHDGAVLERFMRMGRN